MLGGFDEVARTEVSMELNDAAVIGDTNEEEHISSDHGSGAGVNDPAFADRKAHQQEPSNHSSIKPSNVPTAAHEINIAGGMGPVPQTTPLDLALNAAYVALTAAQL